MNTIAIDPVNDVTRLAYRCLYHINRYGDGLSVDHLSQILAKPVQELQQSLDWLAETEKAIHANDNWYYPMEEPKYVEPDVPQPIDYPEPPKDKLISVIEKLKHWFNTRHTDAPPIPVKDLAILLGTNPNTLGKTLPKFLCSLDQEAAKKLESAIMRKVVQTGFSTAAPIKPSEPVIADIEEITPPTPTVANDDHWVAEFRGFMSKHGKPPAWLEWRETLLKMDEVFNEMGVPESHRTRKHLREIESWLVY